MGCPLSVVPDSPANTGYSKEYGYTAWLDLIEAHSFLLPSIRFHPSCLLPLRGSVQLSMWLSAVLLCYTSTDFMNGIVSPRLCLHWGIKLARDCSWELARSVRIAGTQSSLQCPGLGALLGACQVLRPERCRGGSGAALAPGHSRCPRRPAGSAAPEPAQAPGSRVVEGEGRCGAGSARQLLKGYILLI